MGIGLNFDIHWSLQITMIIGAALVLGTVGFFFVLSFDHGVLI